MKNGSSYSDTWTRTPAPMRRRSLSCWATTVASTCPPDLARFEGRAAVAGFFRGLFSVDNPGDWRLVPTRANGQPAAANYVRPWGESEYRAATFDVLRFDHGTLVEITTFGANMFPLFDLPLTLSATFEP